MAEIFLAVQRALGDVSKVVVLKRMLPHLSSDEAYVKMFLDEARLASRLSHPNVVQVFDFGEVDGRYYLAMEYLAGESLGNTFRHAFKTKRPMPVPVALSIAAAICDGLHYAHEYSEGGGPMNVVHRDMSPSNVMLTYQGGVKVVDFGIARARDRVQDRTGTDMLKGKIAYCAPEQFRGGEIDRRTDIFSLGIVLFEILTGRRLFRRASREQTMFAALEMDIPAPSTLRPAVTEELDAIVLKALQREPDERYATARDMRQALEGLMSGPPVRLDEYLREVFGEERARQRLDVFVAADDTATEVASIPVVKEQPSSSPVVPSADEVLPGSEAAVAEAPTVQQRRASARTAVAPTAGEHEPALAGGEASTTAHVSKPRLGFVRVLLALALVALVAAGVAFGWTFLFREDGTFERAMALAQSGEHERARMLLDTYLVEHPDDADALVLRLLVQWWTTAPHVEAAVERARAGPLDPAQRAMVEGIVLINGGRYAEAVAELKSALAEYPDRPELLYALGEALWHSQHYREGADVLASTVHTDPTWEMALHHPVDFYLDQRELDAVTALADRIAPMHPSKAAELRGAVAFSDGLYEESANILNAALATHPDEPRLWTALAEAYTVSVNPKRARPALNKAFELSPVDDREDGAASNLAELHLYRGDLPAFLALVRSDGSLRVLMEALWREPLGVSRDRPATTGLLTPPIWVAIYLEEASAMGRDERLLWEHYPEPDVRALGRGLTLEASGELEAAGKAYAEGLEAESSGELRMLLSHHLARVRKALGDDDGAANACIDVLHPRRYETYRALIAPDCWLWSGDAAGSPAGAEEAYRKASASWLNNEYVLPAVREARSRLGDGESSPASLPH